MPLVTYFFTKNYKLEQTSIFFKFTSILHFSEICNFYFFAHWSCFTVEFDLSATGLSVSAESVKRPSIRRNSSREKARIHRTSSKRNKENGTKIQRNTSDASKSRSLETVKSKTVRVSIDQPAEKILKNSEEVLTEPGKDHMNLQTADISIGPQDCTEMDVQTFHVTLTYKPRI